jgi:hypothetical protein
MRMLLLIMALGGCSGGAAGKMGDSGPAGPMGAPGVAGAEGATGPMGVPGATGAPGATGPIGAPGMGASPPSPSPGPANDVLTTDGNNTYWADVRAVLAAGDEAGLVVKGTYTGTGGTPPWTGPGERMMWYPQRAAFRAGGVLGNEWDDAYVGDYSVAFGSSVASGVKSTAFGASTASGDGATSMGQATASGLLATATGAGTIASGDYSTAIGNLASTNGQYGSIVLSDRSSLPMKSFNQNEFAVQATGGIRFITRQQSTLTGSLDSLGTTVTGTGTNFNTTLIGLTIVAPDNDTQMIVGVQSSTSLTVSAPFATKLNGAPFHVIAPSVIIEPTGTSLHTSSNERQLSLVNDSVSNAWDFYSFDDKNLYLNNPWGTKVSFFDNGNVSIGGGSASINHTLGVTGTIAASGAISANTTPDLAETIPAAGDVEAADVVCADRRHRERVVRCGGRDAGPILGVISDGTSSFLINSHGGREGAPLTGQPLVLAGRVLVKVSTENGPIAIGDWLAPSSQAGVAMRATEPGPVVGIALESFSGKRGAVLCFVKAGEGNVARLAQENAELRAQNRSLEERLARLEGAMEILSQSSSAIMNKWTKEASSGRSRRCSRAGSTTLPPS